MWSGRQSCECSHRNYLPFKCARWNVLNRFWNFMYESPIIFKNLNRSEFWWCKEGWNFIFVELFKWWKTKGPLGWISAFFWVNSWSIYKNCKKINFQITFQFQKHSDRTLTRDAAAKTVFCLDDSLPLLLSHLRHIHMACWGY